MNFSLLFLEQRQKTGWEPHDGKDKTELKELNPENTVSNPERQWWNTKKHSKSAKIKTRNSTLADNYLGFLNNTFFCHRNPEILISSVKGSIYLSVYIIHRGYPEVQQSWRFAANWQGKPNTDVLFQDLGNWTSQSPLLSSVPNTRNMCDMWTSVSKAVINKFFFDQGN